MGFASCGRTSRTSAGHHRPKAKRHPAGAGAVFCLLPSLTKASFDAPSENKKAHDSCHALCFCSVIRLGFAKVRCFTGESGALLVPFELVNELIYNVISVFLPCRSVVIYWTLRDKISLYV